MILLREISSRIRISESCRLYKYHDANGVTTIGWGYALEGQRPPISIFSDAEWNKIQAAPTAIDSQTQNAVTTCITQAQADALFDAILPTYIGQARASLDAGIFDALTPARQFVIVDLSYNLGADGWAQFVDTRAAICAAQRAKNAGDEPSAHISFIAAASGLRTSLWYSQTGDRARRDVAIMAVGTWCSPTGDGSDIYSVA